MTDQKLLPQEILSNKANFADYVQKHRIEIESKLVKGYPEEIVHVGIADLTQKEESLINMLSELTRIENAYGFWYLTSPKEELMKIVNGLNSKCKKGVSIFVIKMFEANKQICYETIAIPPDGKRTRNESTPTTLLQNEFWENFNEVADEMTIPDVKIVPSPKHWRTISIGKAHSSIRMTFAVTKNCLTCGLVNTHDSDKAIFDKLLKSKAKIEKEIGAEFEWSRQDGKEGSQIVKTFDINSDDKNAWKKPTEELVTLAEKCIEVFKKYI